MSARFSHSLFVVLIFTLLGPLLGGILYGALMALLSMLENPDTSINFITLILAFLPLTYVIGGAQAFITGMITAIKVWRHGSAPLWVPILAAIICAIVIQGHAFETPGRTVVFIGIHMSAAALCWLVLRYALSWNKATTSD